MTNFVDVCAKFGIPVVEVNRRWLAWGCVSVKVKRAELRPERGDNRFRFDFASWEITSGLDCDVLVLACEWEPTRTTYHFFDPGDAVLYNGDKLKACVTFKPGAVIAQRRNLPGMWIMTQTMMDDALDRVELIEAARVARSESLRVHRKR